MNYLSPIDTEHPNTRLDENLRAAETRRRNVRSINAILVVKLEGQRIRRGPVANVGVIILTTDF